MRLRHMEESQQVKKLKNLKSIVLLGTKNSPMGSSLKRKRYSPFLKQEKKKKKKKPVKPSVRVMSKTKTRDQKICLSEFYLL